MTFTMEPVVEEPHILDSGDRTEFASGAVRDMRVGKGRCDLLPLDVAAACFAGSEWATDDDIPVEVLCQLNKFTRSGEVDCLIRALNVSKIFPDIPTMLLEVAKHFEEGAKKYGDNNWQKGIPVNVYIDSGVRHYLKYLRGDTDEPHDKAFCWNMLCAIWTAKHMPELNPYGKEES